ncbi:MAG: hypothetical protein IJ344_06075 [Clostridia bacterium]|nr:hypothetical protein [Clostridia bacterium]
MKKLLCLTLALLTLLSLCACSAANSMEAPEEESESSVFSSQREENQSVEAENTPSAPEEPPVLSPSPAPSPTPTPKPSFSELPLPLEEIYFDVSKFGNEGTGACDYSTLIFNIPAYCTFPTKVMEGAQTAVFKFYVDTEYHIGRAACIENRKEYLLLLDAIAAGRSADALSEEYRWVKKNCFDEQGNPILSVIDAEKARTNYALDFETKALEQGEDALWQQVKVDWMARCKQAGITAVDVGKDYLYIFCTGPQLISLAKEEEHRLLLYTVDSVSLQTYLEDRVNIVK